MRKVSSTILASALLIWTSTSVWADPGIDAARPVKQAESNFFRTHARLCVNHPLAGELDDARKGYSKAYRKVEQVRREIKNELQAKPEVRQIDLQIKSLSETIRPGDSIERRTQIAGEMLELRKIKTRLLAKASEDNLNLMVAQAEFEDAYNLLREIEDQFAMILRADPTFAAARENLASARRSIPTLSDALGG